MISLKLKIRNHSFAVHWQCIESFSSLGFNILRLQERRTDTILLSRFLSNLLFPVPKAISSVFIMCAIGKINWEDSWIDSYLSEPRAPNNLKKFSRYENIIVKTFADSITRNNKDLIGKFRKHGMTDHKSLGDHHVSCVWH